MNPKITLSDRPSRAAGHPRTTSESEERFRALIEHSYDALAVVHANGAIIYASPSTQRVLGYAMEEFVGRNVFELPHPDDLGKVEFMFAEVVREPESAVATEVRMRHKEGSWRWVEAISTNLLSETSIKGIVVNYRDITERKQAEEERADLLESERKARLQSEAAQQRLEIQHAVSRALMDPALDRGEVASRVLGAIGENMGWDLGALWVAEPQTVVLRCFNTWHAPAIRADEYESVTSRMTLWVGEGLAGRVFASGEAIWVSDVLKQGALTRLNAVAQEGWHTAILSPVRGESGVLGVIEFLSRQTREADEEMLQCVAALGNQIGQFIERRRAEELTRELSTPVLPIRERLLLLPVIGVIDPQRAAQLTDRLLGAIRNNRARAVVVDVTGVAMMNSNIANHLVKTVEAARLLGATVIITGISPDVAQTLVRLGVDLSEISTVGDLQGGIEKAERLLGYKVVRVEKL